MLESESSCPPIFLSKSSSPAGDEMNEKLLDSPDDPDEKQIEQAWINEARRRLKECDEGRAKLIPAEEVFRCLRARMGR
jgi:hypothetical protein